MSRVFVSRPLPPEAMAMLQGRVELSVGPESGAIPRERWQAELALADGVVSMLSDRLDRELLAAAPRLRIVANYAAGYNNVDLAAAEELGIWVTNTPDATTEATADCALGLMLAVARRIPESEAFLRAGRFEGWTPTHFLGALLSGATLGIVGMGRIGQATARRARAFGMQVVYSGRRRTPEGDALGGFVGFEELLARADVVSLHCPLVAETRHLIDARAFARMKPGAILVNTSRGPVVDEAALAEALHSGHLGGAGLDVYEEEPKVHPRLLTAPRTVLVPHIGTSTLRTRLAMAEKALGDLLRVLAGELPRHAVNRPPRPR